VTNTKKRLLIFLCLLSVCFNLFFILGYIVSRHTARTLATPAGKINLVAKKLELNQDQRRIFESLTEEVRSTSLQLKKKHRAEVDAFWNEIVKPSPDPNIVASGIDLYANLNTQVNEMKLKALVRYLDKLTPRQREKYVKLLRRKSKKN